MPSTEKRGFHIILVNYRSTDGIRALFASGALRGHQVTVVDNGDDPTGVTTLCRRHEAEAILLPDNIGFARAINHVVSRVSMPDRPWLLLNPDITLTAADLESLGRSLEFEHLDGVAPLLVLPSGRLQVGIAGAKLSLWSVVVYFLFIAHLAPWCRGIFYTRRQSKRGPHAAWLAMACMLLAPDAFERYGPIPEDELVYAEDVAWGTLATAQGARLRLVPTVTVGHESGGSGGNAVWDAALERLMRRRLGPVRGTLAIVSMRIGLKTRRVLHGAVGRRPRAITFARSGLLALRREAGEIPGSTAEGGQREP